MAVSHQTHPDFYNEFLAERDSILEHKWYLSEQTGQDVGFERALANWIINHRERWLEERKKRQT